MFYLIIFVSLSKIWEAFLVSKWKNSFAMVDKMNEMDYGGIEFRMWR